jgi:hypothetical protein
MKPVLLIMVITPEAQGFNLSRGYYTYSCMIIALYRKPENYNQKTGCSNLKLGGDYNYMSIPYIIRLFHEFYIVSRPTWPQSYNCQNIQCFTVVWSH